MSTPVEAPKKLLIFGASGLIGSRITKAIVQNKQSFDRIAIFTSPNTVKTKAEFINWLKGEGVEIIEGDATNPEDIKRAYKNIDTVISAVGRNVIETQVEWIRLADQEPGVRRFFPSEYGTDIEYGPKSIDEKPHQKKIKVRAAIRAAKNLDYTFLVTGPYADGDGGLYFGTGGAGNESGHFDVKNKEATLIGDGNLKVSFTTMNDVGKLLVLALLHPEESRNKALRVNSFTTTDREILREFEKQTGGEPWKVSYTSVAELEKLEKKAWDEGVPYATRFTLKRIWAEGGTLYDKRDNYLIDGESIVDTLQDAVAQSIKVQTAS